MKIDSRVVKGGLGLVGLGLGCIMLATGCNKEKPATEAITGDLKQTVAEVNGEIITLADVTNAVNMLRTGQVPDIDPNATELDLQKRAVDDLISQRLIYLEAKKVGKVPTDQEAQDALAQFAQQQFGGDSIFQAELAKMNLTRDDFLREWQRNQGARRFFQETIRDTVNVTEDQARTYFDTHPEEFQRPEMVHARHIMTQADQSAPPAAAAQAESKIREVHQRLQAGGNFEQLAQQYSEDPRSGQAGGDLGFFRKGQMPAPLDSIAFLLEPGMVSEPLRSPFGWHILRVEEKKPAGAMDYSEILVPKLQSMLADKRAYEKMQAMVNDLKTSAKIKRKV